MADINADDFGKVLDREVSPEAEVLTPEAMETIFESGNNQGTVRTNDLATQNALIQDRGTDLATINLAKADNDATLALDIAAEELFTSIEGKIADAGAAFNTIAPDQAQGVLDQMVNGQRGVNDMRLSPVSREMAVIQRASSVPLAQAVREELAFNLAVRNEIATMMDDQGKLDFISDIGGQFIPFRLGMDFEDTKEAIKEHAQLKDVIDGESIVGMVGSWQALSTERKTALLPALTEAILASTGVDYSLGLGIPFLKTDKNVLGAAGILLRFLQPEGGTRALETVQALSVLDVVGLGVGSGGKLAVTASTSARAGQQLAKLGKLPLNTRKIMEGVMGNAAEYTRKKHNPVKLIAQAGDVKQAARINLKVLTDTEMSKAYGMPSDVAYTNTMPMRASSMNPEFIKGLVSETAEALNGFLRGQKGFVRSMTSESELLRLGVINTSERAVVIRNFYQKMTAKSEDYLQEGIHLTDVKVLDNSINAQGFSYEYTITNNKELVFPADGSEGIAVPRTVTAFRSWKVDEATGNFVETVSDLSSTMTSSSIPGQSPAAWSKTKAGAELDFNDAVKQSVALEDLAVATKGRINENWLAANESIGGLMDNPARLRVESIELAGDEFLNTGTQVRGKVFTTGELTAGIQTSEGTVYLTKPNEVLAYYKRRMFADSLWDMQNYVSRRELQIAGFDNSITIKGQNVAVKQFEDTASAQASLANRPNHSVWLANEDVTTTLTAELIGKMYAKNRVLVRSRNDWNVTGAGDLAVGGEVVEYMFIEVNRLRALPEQVLHYKNGYVPKINEGVEFVVKQKFPVKKAGVKGHTIDKALRAFSSKKDADTFIAQQVATVIRKNPQADPEEVAKLFEVADGSAMGQLERTENALSGSGGLYTGTRSVDDLLMGLDGAKLDRMAPGEAFGRYIDHMGTALSRNEWRIGQEKQWLNTVAKMDSGIKIQGFNGTHLPATPEGKALGRLRDQINTWNRVSSKQESLFEGAAQKYHDWVLEGTRTHLGLNPKNIQHALWLKHSDPIAAVLTANMHVMLGVLNPAQLFVQASAAVVGLSLAKVSAIPGIIATTARFAMMDNIKNPGTLTKVMAKMVNVKDMTGEDALIYDAWNRSGLRESVASNADMNYVSATGVGLAADAGRLGSTLSLSIYRSGELTNRRISFISAFTRWRETNVGKAVDDEALLSIIQEANLTMMEMNAANKAWWQGGADKTAMQRVFSLTGQFQQVLTKTLELTFKGKSRGGFNAAQKARIGLGQTVFFGSLGVPLGAAVVAGMTRTLNFEPSPETTAVINQGLVGFISREGFGADIEAASRASLFAGTASSIKETITSKDPMWSRFLSVTATTLKRGVEAAVDLVQLAQSQAMNSMTELEPFLAHDRSSENQLSDTDITATMTDIATIMLSIPTSGRNLMKARLMHNAGKILDRRGRVVVSEKEGVFSTGDKWFVGFGFQMTREARARIMQQGSRGVDEEITEAADVVIAAYHRFVYTHDMNPKYAKSVTNMVQLMHEALDNPYKIDKMMEQVNRKIFTDPDSLEAREMKKFFERTAPEHISLGLQLDTGSVFDSQAIIQPFQRVLEQEIK